MSLKAFGIIDEILDIGHCEEPDWKARKKSSQHQDKPGGLPFQDNSPESIMSQSLFNQRLNGFLLDILQHLNAHIPPALNQAQDRRFFSG